MCDRLTIKATSGFGYNGEYYNAASGMIYLRARFYAPEMNRFGQKDLLRGSAFAPQSLNRYVYVQNDPINYVDSNGRSLKSAWNAVKGAVVGAVKGAVTGATIGAAVGGVTGGIVGAVAGAVAGGIAGAISSKPHAEQPANNPPATPANANPAQNRTPIPSPTPSPVPTPSPNPIPSPEPGPPPVLPPSPQYWKNNSTSHNNTASPTVQLPNSIDHIRTQFGCEAGAYNRDAAVEYARIWAGNTNTSITTNSTINSIIDYVVNMPRRNTDFYKYKTNCANFVSQCLLAGGINMTEEWHTNPTAISGEIIDILIGNYYSFEDTGGAWAQADGQYAYFLGDNKPIIIVNQNNPVDSIAAISDALRNNNIQAGDLMYFGESDADGNAIIHHATIITSVGKYSLQGTTQGRYLTGGVPPVRFSM